MHKAMKVITLNFDEIVVAVTIRKFTLYYSEHRNDKNSCPLPLQDVFYSLSLAVVVCMGETRWHCGGCSSAHSVVHHIA